MKTQFRLLSRTIVALGYTVGVACLVAAMVLSIVQSPASAAGPNLAPINQTDDGGEPASCVAPPGFDNTVRLHHSGQTSVSRRVEVNEPEMFVTVTIVYFQDYDADGCPFDCSTGDCQTDEIGEGQTPFGPFEISDGSEGADDGKIRHSGILPQGVYKASFEVTSKGSINIGIRVSKKPVKATKTPVPPTDIPPTDIPPTDIPPTDIPPTDIPSATPTEPVLPPGQPTATPSEPVLPPGEPTATPSEPVQPPGEPTATEIGPTATPTEPVLPPAEEPTATPTEPEEDEPRPRPRRTPTPGAPATLPPPSQPTSIGQAPVIVPVTGADLTLPAAASGFSQSVFLKLGVGLLGLALVLHGFSRKIR